MRTGSQFADLPGGALVEQGLRDLAQGHQTIPACLVEIARKRFERAGWELAAAAPEPVAPELRLYRLLRLEGGDAYSRYNALTRELDSFAQAAFKS